MRLTIQTFTRAFCKLKVALFFILLVWFLFSGCENENSESDFSFAFMTDIHLHEKQAADSGFRLAINEVNKLNPDFVITGGDLIMDALGQTYKRADFLYRMYTQTASLFNMPVYNTLGNHEVFGLYEKSGVSPFHPEYGKQMFKNRFNYESTYRSFNHKNWHFMILDGIGYTYDGNYYGHIDSLQMEWIKKDLETVDSETPIVISTHIPFVSATSQLGGGSKNPMDDHGIENGHEVLKLFLNHNLRIVLQGHLHIVEEIIVKDIHFITGGAVSARWWAGPRQGFEEGFVMIKADENSDDFIWEYIDYGWDAVKK